MYKVFINDKPIIFTSSLKNEEKFPVFKIDLIVFEEIIHKLKYTNLGGIYIYDLNKKECFEKFLNHFKVVTAGGGLVKNKKNEFLFIFRGHRWDLPKGHTEKGETIEETSIREVEEECGISNLKIEKFLIKTYHIYFYKKKPEIKETYWFLMTSDYEKELIPQLEEGITEVGFKSKSEIPKLFENTYSNIKLVYQKYLELEKS